jgi:hypothetical protein
LIQANWNERKEKSPGSIDKPGLRTEEANSREKATVEDNANEEEEQNNNDSAGESKVDGELYFELVKQVQEKIARILGSTWDLGYKMTTTNTLGSCPSTASIASIISSKHSSHSKKSGDQNEIDDQIPIEPW